MGKYSMLKDNHASSRRIRQSKHMNISVLSLSLTRRWIVTGSENVIGGDSSDDSIKMSRFHLPHVNGAIRAADDQEVVQRSPLDNANREQMTTGDHMSFQLVFLNGLLRI